MTDDWKEVMDDVGAGKYGPWHMVRDLAVEALEEDHRAIGREGEYGISSSDINHTIYGMVKSGDLKPWDGQTFLIRRVR